MKMISLLCSNCLFCYSLFADRLYSPGSPVLTGLFVFSVNPDEGFGRLQMNLEATCEPVAALEDDCSAGQVLGGFPETRSYRKDV